MAYKGVTINTGIFKSPVQGRVTLRTLNLDGDTQADLSVHGGPYKAVYAYPSEHYEYWRKELPDTSLSWGAFGENFTTEGLLEDDLYVGDRLRIGSAVVMVRQPRMPCYKLAAKFQRDDMIEHFAWSGRSGFYFSVEQQGDLGEGDMIEKISQQSASITIAEMNQLLFRDRYNRELLEKAIGSTALPKEWREHFLPRLNRLAANR